MTEEEYYALLESIKRLGRSFEVLLKKPVAIIFMGQSGSGKGTLSTLLQEFLLANDPDSGAIRSVTGDQFREWQKSGTYISGLVKESNEKGELQLLLWATMLWSKFLDGNFTGKEHIIFDGSPRREDEAKIMESLIEFLKIDAVVVHIKTDDELCAQRLIERKDDDRKDTSTPEKIAEKLSWYKPEVLPAVEYFKNSDFFRVVEIEGERPTKDVFEEIFFEIFNKRVVF